VFNFNKVLPEPVYKKPYTEYVKGKPMESYPHIVEWQNWRNDNWGTKWNIIDETPTLPTVSGVSSQTSDGGRIDIPSDYNIDLGEDGISMSFYTAWSPPDGIYDAIVDKYPTLDVNWFYREDNMQMSGWL